MIDNTLKQNHSVKWLLNRFRENGFKLSLKDTSVVTDTQEIFAKICKQTEFGVIGTLGDTTVNVTVKVVFDPNADYDYYISTCVRHDGTLLFVRNAIDECLSRVASVQTYYTPKGAPERNCRVVYTLGDCIVESISDEAGAPKDKKWMSEVTRVFLPIKYDIQYE